MPEATWQSGSDGREPPGADIVLLNAREEVLLVLRDDKPEIPYPNTWALLGGYLEPGETPAAAVLREIAEEIGVHLTPPPLFRTYRWPECTEHIFWQRLELDPARVVLAEGQRLAWFRRDELNGLAFASHYGQILDDFFACAPHRPSAVG
jgi:8-oxo-dGTP diphosphatase